MPQDAFHIRRSVAELNALLVGGKINRISQVNKDELTFIVYTGKSTVKLIVSANASNARVCLSTTEKEPLAVAPNFCMLLRKHLQNAEIRAVRQHEFERIVEIDLHCTTDFSESDRTLVCELMGKYSNVVLVEKGTVLGALKTTSLVDDTHRILFTGAKYVYPTPQDKASPLDSEEILKRLKNFMENRSGDLDKETLAEFVFGAVSGVALPTAREMVKRAEKENGSLALCLSPSAKTPIWKFVGAFCLNEPNNPCVRVEKGVITDFFAFPVDGGVATPSLCKAQDEFYTKRETKKGFDDKKRRLESAVKTQIKKINKRLQECREKLCEAEKAEENRVKGELLTANLYAMEKGLRFVELVNWYDEAGGKMKISLDPLLSPAKNAQKYFKLYNKQKRAKEILLPREREDENELSYAESILSFLAVAETDEDLKEIETELTEAGVLRAQKAVAKKNKKETPIPFREYEHNGKKILVGRNNLQNERLLKIASPDDIWLHVQKYHSSHVIIFAEGGQVCDETLLYGAKLCAYYSQAQGGDKIPVDYCKRKFVKKPKGSKAGFVTYTDYKTVLVNARLEEN
ncbi:MAG: fibronectin/fibrinogen-binding protein [Clostridiales bacterium]|nr:fibronectin/fibrinogen-binding protein [Clostridiales bacterium]